MQALIRGAEDVTKIEAASIEALDLATSSYDLICRSAQRYPDRIAIFGLPDGSADNLPSETTYAQLLARIHQCANLLHDLGVGPEDAVSLLMPLIPETNIALWAAEAAGIANPLNPFLEIEHLAGIMHAAGTKVIIGCHPSISPDPWPKIEALRKLLPDLKAVIQVGGEGRDVPNDVILFDTAIATQPDDRLKSGREIAPDDIAAYFHTGGTTGLPKLARHTHRGQVLQAFVQSSFTSTDPDGVIMVGLPMFHVGGTLCGSLTSFSRGQSVVMLGPEGFRDPLCVRDLLRNVERFKTTALLAVPAIWSALLGLAPGGADISSVEFGIVGGAPLSVDVANAVKERIGVVLAEGWGMTELHGFATMNPRQGRIKVGSVGIRPPFLRLKVCELDGVGGIARDCGVDEIGVVLVRGPQVIAGYVEEAHNERAWVDGDWLDTGDLGRIDGDGYLWLTGRAKDVIIRGGHNIDPALVEDALYQHPGVELAASVGRPDQRVGEIPVAYVQMRQGAAFDEDDLKHFVRERVPERAANPAEIIRLEPLPLTAVGKIHKPTLRLEAAQRTLARELTDAVADDEVDVQVSVAPDKTHGTLATIVTAAADPARADQAAERCAEVMAKHTLRYEIATVQ